jgi:hypothetical protein
MNWGKIPYIPHRKACAREGSSRNGGEGALGRQVSACGGSGEGLFGDNVEYLWKKPRFALAFCAIWHYNDCICGQKEDCVWEN